MIFFILPPNLHKWNNAWRELHRTCLGPLQTLICVIRTMPTGICPGPQTCKGSAQVPKPARDLSRSHPPLHRSPDLQGTCPDPQTCKGSAQVPRPARHLLRSPDLQGICPGSPPGLHRSRDLQGICPAPPPPACSGPLQPYSGPLQANPGLLQACSGPLQACPGPLRPAQVLFRLAQVPSRHV